MDRAPDFGSGGRGFESFRAYRTLTQTDRERKFQRTNYKLQAKYFLPICLV